MKEKMICTPALSLNKRIMAARIASLCAFIIQIAIAVKYALGVAVLYGERTDIENMLNAAFGIFHMKGAVYRGIFGCAVSVVYFLIFVLIVIDILDSVRILKKLYSKSASTKDVEEGLKAMHAGSKLIFVRVLMFMICVAFVNPYFLSTGTKILIVLWVAAMVITEAAYYILMRYTLKSILFNIGYLAVVILCVAFILVFVQTSVVEQVINSFQIMTSGGGFVQFLLTNASLIASVIICWNAVKTLSVLYVDAPLCCIQDETMRITYSTGVYLAVPVVQFCINDNSITFSEIINILSTYIPLILGAASLYVMRNTTTEKVLVPESVESDPEQNAPKDAASEI